MVMTMSASFCTVCPAERTKLGENYPPTRVQLAYYLNVTYF